MPWQFQGWAKYYFWSSHERCGGFCRGVRFRLSMCGLLLAWLCASGGLLDIAQVFAWSRMYAGYAQTMSAGEALTQTFDPAKPCELCVAVLKARKASDDSAKTPSATSVEIEKIVMIAHGAAFAVIAPALEAWPAALHEFAGMRVDPVPTPPPRGGAVGDIV